MKAYYGLMISNCGITDVGLDRMARLGDAVVHQTVSGKLKQLAKRYDVVLNKWDSELANYGIVLDNVDIMTRPRREKADVSNTMHHMVQAIAVEERIKTDPIYRLRQEIPVENISPADVFPTAADDVKLQKMMVRMVLEVWSKIPALKCIELQLPDDTHQYTPQMAQKTNHVSHVHLILSLLYYNFENDRILYCPLFCSLSPTLLTSKIKQLKIRERESERVFDICNVKIIV